MYYRQLFPKPQKYIPSGEISKSAQLLLQAGYIYKENSGLYSILPLGKRVFDKINQIIRQGMAELEIEELIMPTLSSINRWSATGRDKMEILYRIPSRSGSEYVLNPTHEELATPMVQHFIQSYKDFPVSFFQIYSKYRDEFRVKSGILRTREFIMKDAYSFHTSKEDLQIFYDRMLQKYAEIFTNMGIGKETFLTYASGGDFSKFSHEFQTISEIGEDKIYLCSKCNIAINQEIKNEHKSCPSCNLTDFIEHSSIEVGNIFKLSTKFSAPLNFTVTNEDGNEVPIITASYGIGSTRCIAAIAETKHDKNGLIWPYSVAPFNAHLINIGKSTKYNHEVYNLLKTNNISVLCDDSKDSSAGEKFAIADLLGCPIQIITSPKLEKAGNIEVKNRIQGTSKTISISNIHSIFNY